MFKNKTVLVTGGTGSFGKKFLKILSRKYGNQIKKLIIFSRDELKQYEMSQIYDQNKYPYIRFFIGDVRDRERVYKALKDVDYVIHAAALKQVPTSEYNPFETIKTNVLGTQNIVDACIDNKVKKSNERIHIIINPNGTKPSSKPKRPKKTVQNTDASSDPKAASSYSNKEKPTTKFTEQEDGYPVGYTTTGLNVRTGPGTQYSKLTTFPPNSELIILTEQNDWLQVRGQANGEVVIGWVHRDYLSAN